MKNILLLIATFALCLIGAEVAFRAAGYAPRTLEANRFFVDGVETTWSVPDGELGWINRPGVSISIEDGAAPMTYWSQGRRASRENSDYPQAGLPVMVVGGSNAQSYGVRDEDSFPFRLGKKFPGLWFENFGNGGFGTVQTLMLTDRMLDNFYADKPPALIIATFADSHVPRNVSDQTWVYSISDSEGRYVSPPHYRVAQEGFTFHPFKTIGLWPLESNSALVTALHHIWLQSIAFATADQGARVTQYAFSQLAELAGSRGAKFLVVVLEDYRGMAPDIFKDATYPVLNCSGYETTAPETYLLGGGGHPNALSHAHFAECIGQWIGANFAAGTLSLKP